MVSSGATPRERSLAGDLRWGFGWGVAYAVAFSLFVAVGGLMTGGQNAARQGTTVGRVIALYWLTGPAGGLVAGLLRPLTATRLGTAAVGAVVGTLVYGGVAIALEGASRRTALVAVLAGVGAGVPTALLLRSRARQRAAAAGADPPVA